MWLFLASVVCVVIWCVVWFAIVVGVSAPHAWRTHFVRGQSDQRVSLNEGPQQLVHHFYLFCTYVYIHSSQLRPVCTLNTLRADDAELKSEAYPLGRFSGAMFPIPRKKHSLNKNTDPIKVNLFTSFLGYK